MTLGLVFGTPWLLAGAAAMLIPLALHLLARARAQQMLFPTLRFLRLSMEKTARQRRIQHLLLMILRMLLLLMLALSVSEPITQAVGGWIGGQQYAAVLILDNSLSMGVNTGTQTRLDRARDEARSLLQGADRPALAALLTTNGGFVSQKLTGEAAGTGETGGLAMLRQEIEKTRLGYGRAPLHNRVRAAVEMLRDQTIPQKSIFLFSDLQRISAEDLLRSRDLAESEDIHLLVVHTGGARVNNVGIAKLEISGQRIVDQVLTLTATLVNSSPTDRVVDVALRVNGGLVGQKVRQSLAAAGREGSSANVRFHHVFSQAGTATGEVVVEQPDDLVQDNVRAFSLEIGGRIRALVVRGPPGDPTTPYLLGPDAALRLALAPYSDESRPWSITPETVEADQFSSTSLNGVDVVFLCDVPSFTSEQAASIAEFAAGGGLVVFFLGPNVDPENYNQRFVQEIAAEGGLLPGRLQKPVGEVGPTAGAVPTAFVDREHEYFKGLYETLEDYLSLIVQRYYTLKLSARGARTLIELENGDPLLLVKPFGDRRGRVVLCTTAASRLWSNLPMTGLFLPAVTRMSLSARQKTARDDNFLAGAPVPLYPELPPGTAGKVTLDVFLPPEDDEKSDVVTVPAARTAGGHKAEFTRTSRPGIYHWKASAPGTDSGKEVSGAFAVHPDGGESDLASYAPDTFAIAMANRGIPRVYVGPTVADASAAASTVAKGRNWWDVLLVFAILLLVAESVVANRFRGKSGPAIPAHLNPRLAGP
ncbi:MAG TPA: BatA domain-containing protein [Phycisphaerae bacterium]|nr:BatA domain-containing protein [Phycisphaerae bacterium]